MPYHDRSAWHELKQHRQNQGKKSKYFTIAKNSTISRENVELIYSMTPQIQHPTVLKAPSIFVTEHCHIPAMS